MPKVEVLIPKGTKCKNGEVCDKELQLDLDIPETKPKVEILQEPKITIPSSPTSEPNPPPPAADPGPPQVDKEVLSKMIPTGTNFALCKGDKCKPENLVQNENLSLEFQTCPKCGSNSVPKGSDFCPTCGGVKPEDSNDFWQESELKLEP